jgi:hypothetical protein
MRFLIKKIIKEQLSNKQQSLYDLINSSGGEVASKMVGGYDNLIRFLYGGDFKKYVEIAQEAIKGNLPKAVKVKAQEVEVKASKAEVIEPVEKVASKAVEPKKETATKKDTAPKTTAVKKPATAKTTTEKAPVKKPSAPKTTAASKTTTKKEV